MVFSYRTKWVLSKWKVLMEAYASYACWTQQGTEFHMALNVSFFTQQYQEITWLAADAEWDSEIMIIIIVLIQGHGSNSNLVSVIFKRVCKI